MVDIAWEGIPNWVVAVSSLLTLGAAIFAGVFAGRAAHWTKAQAKASQRQVDLAHEALTVAQQDSEVAKETADRQRAEAERSYRLLVQAQLDALAPVVLATATPINAGTDESYLWSQGYVGGVWENIWARVAEQLEVPSGERLRFRFTVNLEFKNVSDKVSHIDIVDRAGGVFDGHSDSSMPVLVVPPHEKRTLTWSRYWLSEGLGTDEGTQDTQNGSFRMHFEVRDQGLNVRDTYEFLADLRFFSRDGSRLIVEPKPAFPWEESVAIPVLGRVYERLGD